MHIITIFIFRTLKSLSIFYEYTFNLVAYFDVQLVTPELDNGVYIEN